MKKTFTAALALLTLASIAQPYGQIKYNTSAGMTHGELTGINSGNQGFIMGGFSAAGNLTVQKTIAGGSVPSPAGPTSFQRTYTIPTNSYNCSGSIGTISNPKGPAIMEIPLSGLSEYIIAGAFNQGCFYSYLKNDGSIASPTSIYVFPSASTTYNKPSMTKDASGAVYICGQHDSDMYVIKVGSWAKMYSLGTMLEPRAITVSANGSHIVIVGHCNGSPTQSSDGFFLRVNAANGSVVNFKDYNYLACTWFNCIKVASNPLGGTGYIIGGYNDFSQYTDNALMLKVDSTGNTIWSHIISTSISGSSSKDVMDVVERKPLTGGEYEYYGAAQILDVPSQLYSTSIFKLDKSGTQYSLTHPGKKDEFNYPTPTGTSLLPINMDYTPNGSSDVGLHVYADNNGKFTLIESYFNGVTGCGEILNTIPHVEPGPNGQALNINSTNLSSPCVFPDLIVNTQSFQITPCSAPSVPGGSNARIADITGLSEESLNTGVRIYPNPSNDKVALSFYADNNSVKIEVVNSLGQLIKVVELDGQNSGYYEHEIDFAAMNATSGIYSVNITAGGNNSSHKIIYFSNH